MGTGTFLLDRSSVRSSDSSTLESALERSTRCAQLGRASSSCPNRDTLHYRALNGRFSRPTIPPFGQDLFGEISFVLRYGDNEARLWSSAARRRKNVATIPRSLSIEDEETRGKE